MGHEVIYAAAPPSGPQGGHGARVGRAERAWSPLRGGSTLVGRAENTTTIATACGAGHAGRARARAATFVERKSPVIILCLD